MTVCSGTIEIELLSYANPEHRLHSGRCCEQGIEKNCTKVGKGCTICTLECDPQFHIELKQNDIQVFSYKTSTVARKDNFNFNDLNNDNITNPFAVKLDNLEVLILTPPTRMDFCFFTNEISSK